MTETGRAQPVTVISPVKRWWVWWLRAIWPFANRLSIVKRPVDRLAFIMVAHWSLLTRMPADSGGRARRLPHKYLIFHSNFNDDFEEYVLAFAAVAPRRLRAMWAGTYDCPGPGEPNEFVKYVREHAIPTSHYYCAYPQGSARMISSALALQAVDRALRDTAATLSDEQFAASWEEFVDRNQRLL
jgi:hypothetical protein